MDRVQERCDDIRTRLPVKRWLANQRALSVDRVQSRANVANNETIRKLMMN
jgi:hypothetical protein